MRRIVVDTNVLVAALCSKRGASFKLLSLIGTERFETVVSVPLVLEYEYALNKEALIRLTRADVARVLDYVCAVSRHQDIFFLWRPFLRDPSDDMVLEVSVASGADTIVTFNKRDFAGCDRFGLAIQSPIEFLLSEELL